MRSTFLILILLVLSISATSSPAEAASDRREMQAREAFAASRYQDALDLYVKLYAEHLHPNFLRNIGRCYQNLGDADKAISSFREYLRKAKNVSPEERTEVNGYIAEMEATKKSKETATAVSATAPGPSTQSDSSAGKIKLAPVEPAASSPAEMAPAQTVNLDAPPQPGDESPPVYKRWWFWAAIGGVVAVGLGGAAAAGAFTTKTDATCELGRLCQEQ